MYQSFGEKSISVLFPKAILVFYKQLKLCKLQNTRNFASRNGA